MSQNEFTKENRRLGLPPQVVLDAGLNVFALDLIVESFTQLAGKDVRPVEFTYKGVNIKLQINDAAKGADQDGPPHKVIKRMRFIDLPKGARFIYPDGKDVWVALETYGDGLIAKWEGLDSPATHQSMCCFVDENYQLETEVSVVC